MRARFDLAAVQAEFTEAPSPYCPNVTRAVLASPVAFGAIQPDGGQMGVCVLQTPPRVPAAPGETRQVAKNGKPAYLPSAVELPATPPLRGPILQLRFEDSGPPHPAAVPAPTGPLELPALGPHGEPAPRRQSFVDTTAAACFGHAADYSWLSGQVEYSHILHAWRVRFASVDDCDRYGGSVTLVENSHVDYLREGEYVRVEGHLVDPKSSARFPPYKITAFKVISRTSES